MATKVGSAKATAKLNPLAPKLDLKPISPSSYATENIASVYEFPATIAKQLAALDVLQPNQGFNFFSQIASVLRPSSIKVADAISNSGSSLARRILITGPAGSGKSFVLLQATALALQKKFVVVSLPRGEELVNSSWPYQLDADSNEWRQNEYVSSLLGRINSANANVLQLQNLSRELNFDRHMISSKASLSKLLDIGVQDSAVAHEVLLAFLDEMDIEGRPPMLLTLDNISITSIPSKYRNPDFDAIHPHDLAIVKLFNSYLNGSKSLRNGAVMACTSSLPTCSPKALNIALGLERQNPFETVDPRIGSSIVGAKVVEVGKYTAPESKSIISHYASAGLVRGLTADKITDSIARQKALMGGDVAREIFRSCVKLV